MIPRIYFISLVAFKGDGTGSFSYSSRIVKRTSILPDPVGVQNEEIEKLKREKNTDKIQVIAFNRI